jgi:hypothetical protein
MHEPANCKGRSGGHSPGHRAPPTALRTTAGFGSSLRLRTRTTASCCLGTADLPPCVAALRSTAGFGPSLRLGARDATVSRCLTRDGLPPCVAAACCTVQRLQQRVKHLKRSVLLTTRL